MLGIVLLSGGMDSATVLGQVLQEGWDVIPLNIQYGQRHSIETDRAKQVASFYNLDLRVQIFNLLGVVSSSLLGLSGKLSINRSLKDIALEGIPSSYVPARNTIFLAVAGGIAESVGADVVFYGAHQSDCGGYPDCTPSYVAAMSQALQLGTVRQIKVLAPLVSLSKKEVVKRAMDLGVPLHLTHSCYQGVDPACGICDTCRLRLDAFQQAGYEDPINYQTRR